MYISAIFPSVVSFAAFNPYPVLILAPPGKKGG